MMRFTLMTFLPLRILEEKHASEVLIQLYETPGILRTALYSKITEKGAGKPAVIKRVNEFINAGLIRMEQSPTHNLGQYLFLTDKGIKLAKLALQMEEIIAEGDNRPAPVRSVEDEPESGDEKMNHGAPETLRDSIESRS